MFPAFLSTSTVVFEYGRGFSINRQLFNFFQSNYNMDSVVCGDLKHKNTAELFCFYIIKNRNRTSST